MVQIKSCIEKLDALTTVSEIGFGNVLLICKNIQGPSLYVASPWRQPSAYTSAHTTRHVKCRSEIRAGLRGCTSAHIPA